MSFKPNDRLVAQVLFTLKYGSLSFDPSRVNKLEVAGNPFTSKLPPPNIEPPDVFMTTPGAVKATADRSLPGFGSISICLELKFAVKFASSVSTAAVAPFTSTVVVPVAKASLKSEEALAPSATTTCFSVDWKPCASTLTL